MQRHTQALAIGETMAMVSPIVPGGIAAHTEFAIRPGGAESNVTMHLARLGHTAEWAGYVGEDPLGQLIVSELAAAGVGTDLARYIAGAPTGVYFKHLLEGRTDVLYYRTASAASLMGTEYLDQLRGVRPELLHFTGITAALSGTCLALVRAAVIDRAIDAGRVSFDVNYRPALWDVADAATVLLDLADAADIVFVGLDEAHTLWGVRTADEVRSLITRPEIVVVKDHAVGATSYEGGASHFVSAPPVEVVESVGAGDAFAAGWLSGLLRGQDAEARLALGHAVAGYVLRTTFDDVELPDHLRIGTTR